jgi:hypothetical protein
VSANLIARVYAGRAKALQDAVGGGALPPPEDLAVFAWECTTLAGAPRRLLSWLELRLARGVTGPDLEGACAEALAAARAVRAVLGKVTGQLRAGLADAAYARQLRRAGEEVGLLFASPPEAVPRLDPDAALRLLDTALGEAAAAEEAIDRLADLQRPPTEGPTADQLREALAAFDRGEFTSYPAAAGSSPE